MIYISFLKEKNEHQYLVDHFPGTLDNYHMPRY